MAHVRTLAAAICGGMLLASMPALSATKLDEGFASRYEVNGRQSRPTNRIDEGAMEKDAYYWIQWRDHPVGRTTFRCKVIHRESGTAVVDEEITYADSTSEGYSLCGFTPSKSVHREGTYIFTQYLDGAQVGQATLNIESRYFQDLKLFPWKLALLVFGVSILALALVRRNRGLTPI